MSRGSTSVSSLCALHIASSGLGSAVPENVSGEYATAVKLGENSCGPVTVAPGITTVVQRPGEATISLTHGPLTYHAVRAADGRFTTDTQQIRIADGVVAVAVAGTVGAGKLSADARVWMRTATPCSYVVHWTGVRRGAPVRTPPRR